MKLWIICHGKQRSGGLPRSARNDGLLIFDSFIMMLFKDLLSREQLVYRIAQL